MIEVVLEFVFGVVGEILSQFIFEIGAEFGIVSIKEAFEKKKEPNPVLSISGLIILGLLFGFVSALIYPERILSKYKVTGIGFVILPIVTGLVSNVFGNWRRERGKYTSYLATFWGGFFFSLAWVAVRWFLIKS